MADAADLNSAARKGVRVRIPASAPGPFDLLGATGTRTWSVGRQPGLTIPAIATARLMRASRMAAPASNRTCDVSPRI